MSEKSPITPLGDRVVIRALSDEESGSVSASGIIIPDTAKKEKSNQGVVVATGPGKWNEDGDARLPMEVKVGDKVLFRSWSEAEKVENEEYWVVSESDVQGILN